MRDYDPTTGRYIRADPLGLIDGSSVYGYAMQSPNRYIDPRGEQVMPFPFPIPFPIPFPGTSDGPTMGTIWDNVMDNARDRAQERNRDRDADCDKYCDKARQSVRNAKAKTNALKGCKASDAFGTLIKKAAAWQEHCNARKNRDRVCPEPIGKYSAATEKRALYSACGAYAKCQKLLKKF